MCALQIQAEHASTMLDDEEGLMSCIERYITKQVCTAKGSRYPTFHHFSPLLPLQSASQLRADGFTSHDTITSAAGAHDTAA